MSRENDIINAAWDYFQDLDSNYFEPTPYCNPHIDAFEAGAKWADKTMIEKACNWIKERIMIPYEGKFDGNQPILTDYLTWCEDRNRESTIIVNEFIKAMEL